MNLTEILNESNEIVREYKSGNFISTEKLREYARKLSCNYYEITSGFNIEVFNDYNNYMYQLTEIDNQSVNKATIKADKRHPELRETRKVLEALDKVIWSIKSELSTLNKEIN